MAERFEGLLLAIDTASDVAGIALFEAGELLAETTWRTRQSHSRQLLPAIDWLLPVVERSKSDLKALAVSLGPGSYAGMRVGLSTAKALAYALELPLVGIGRLAADALPLAEAASPPGPLSDFGERERKRGDRGRVVAVQAAGRAELAYAAYRAEGGELVEVVAPRLGAPGVVVDALEVGDVVTGEIERLDADTVAGIEAQGCRLLASRMPRAVSIGVLGLRRLARGEIDNPDTLVPLYLRAPAIGPQPPRK